jgi:hypothetical protein
MLEAMLCSPVRKEERKNEWHANKLLWTLEPYLPNYKISLLYFYLKNQVIYIFKWRNRHKNMTQWFLGKKDLATMAYLKT